MCSHELVGVTYTTDLRLNHGGALGICCFVVGGLIVIVVVGGCCGLPVEVTGTADGAYCK
jgi:hypothetical protein